MNEDPYGNALNTTSSDAVDWYCKAHNRYLAADVGIDDAFEQAIEADPDFALAHVGLARNLHINGNGRAARDALANARDAKRELSEREAGHLNILGFLIEGKSADGYRAARAHLSNYPRDAFIAQSCLGVFGLIGFSGQPGREAETLALAEMLAPHYGDDWWMLSSLAFAQMEADQVGPAETSIDRALELNPRNANGAHHRAHLFYEMGETDAGYAYLDDWLKGYEHGALLHCHLHWHIALWALGRGDTDAMWRAVDSHVDPKSGAGPALNVMTDMAAILYRAELAGVDVPRERWLRISEFASQRFGKPGLAFADVHAALAHAIAGNQEALARITTEARGPAADMVQLLSQAFDAIVAARWDVAAKHLTTVMSDHARIGGSRAQRDLIDHAMVSVLLKLGQREEAHRLLKIRRPRTDTAGMIQGL